MGTCNSSSKGSVGGRKYLSTDEALYETSSEGLYVERHTYSMNDATILTATSDGAGNVTLNYAKPQEYFKQNKKHTYALYAIKCGMVTGADDIHGSRRFTDDKLNKSSKVKNGNDYGGIRAVGMNWSKIKTISGKTYDVSALIKQKGFKWDKSTKSWVKS